MKKIIGFVMFAGLFSISIPAYSQGESEKPYLSGNHFLGLDDSSKSFYIWGLRDGVFLEQFLSKNDFGLSQKCLEGKPNKQIKGIVYKFLNDHPERWHLPIAMIWLEAVLSVCSEPGYIQLPPGTLLDHEKKK